MDILDELARRLPELSAEDRLRVLEYARSLPDAPKEPRPSLLGKYAHRATVPLTKEMFDENRREMCANFPREFPKGHGE